jgi:hypothetical protein
MTADAIKAAIARVAEMTPGAWFSDMSIDKARAARLEYATGIVAAVLLELGAEQPTSRLGTPWLDRVARYSRR